MSEREREQAKRAFERARRVLELVPNSEVSPASVELYADGSGRFFFPVRMWNAMCGDGRNQTVINLIGSTRLREGKNELGEPVIAIEVCGALGREED